MPINFCWKCAGVRYFRTDNNCCDICEYIISSNSMKEYWKLMYFSIDDGYKSIKYVWENISGIARLMHSRHP